MLAVLTSPDNAAKVIEPLRRPGCGAVLELICTKRSIARLEIRPGRRFRHDFAPQTRKV